MSLTRTITQNTLFNAFGRLWEAAVSVVLLAYVIRTLDKTGYGMWALLGPFMGYMALFDFGIGSGYAKFIAEYKAKGDTKRISEIITTGLCVYFVLGVILVVIGWPSIDRLVAWGIRFQTYRGGEAPRAWVVEDLRFLFRWGLVLMAVSGCVSAFTAIQTGLQRMGISNAIGVLISAVKVAGTVVFLEAGYGVRGLLYTNAVVLAIFSPITVAVGFALLPPLRVSPRYLSLGAFRSLFSFGWRTQVSRLSNLIMFETDMVVVGAFFGGLGLVGVYQAGVNLVNKVRQVPLVLMSALIPAASDLDAREDHERLAQLYLRATKYVAVVAVPLFFLGLGMAGPMVRTMFGPGYEVSAWVLRILAVGYLPSVLAGAGITVALGMGRPDLQMKAGMISMVANVILTVALYLTVGFYGIPVATSLSMVVASIWFAAAMTRDTGVSIRDIVGKAVGWPLLAAAPGLVLCFAADWRTSDLPGFLGNAATCMACSGLQIGIYLFVLRHTPFLDGFDRRFLDDHLGLRKLPWLRAIVGREVHV